MSTGKVVGRRLLAEVEAAESGGRAVRVNGRTRTTTAASNLPLTSTG